MLRARYLTGYIIKNVVSSIILVSLILLGVEFFLALLAELNAVGHAHYNISYAAWVVAYRMPGYLYHLFPVAGLIGGMLGLGKLAASRELMVMQVSGFSVQSIRNAVVLGACLVMLLMTLCGEYIAPKLNQQADQIKNAALGKLKQSLVQGIWLKHGYNYLYVERMLDANHGLEATLFSYPAATKFQAIIHSPYVQRQPSGAWLWQHPQQTIWQQSHFKVLHRQSRIVPIHVVRHIAAAAPVATAYLNLKQVYQKINILQQAGLSTVSMRFIFWHRIFQPFITIMMIVLAVPFIFGGLREVSAAERVIIGVGIGFAFYILNQVLGPICLVLQITPFVAAIFPLMLFMLLYMLLSMRLAR